MLSGCSDAPRSGFALLLNRTGCGKLFVNELVLQTHQCPVTGVTVILGLQKDVTADIPINRFLECCISHEAYTALLERQSEALVARVSNLQLDCDRILEDIFSMTQAAGVGLAHTGGEKASSPPYGAAGG